MRHVEAYVTATTGRNQIMFDNINFKRAVLAGLVGTTAMTGLMLAAPMMGTGFFSGSLMAATGSLMGHLVYGAAVGTIYRPSDRAFLGHALHADA
jgi:hypothetical protein